MPSAKTATLMLRLDPAVKRGLQAIAAREHRSLANMVEVLICEGCRRHGVIISAAPVAVDQAAAEPEILSWQPKQSPSARSS